MENDEGVVSLDEVKLAVLVEDREGKVPHQGFRHLSDAVHGELTLPLYELDGNVAVRLDARFREIVLLLQLPVVDQNAAVCQGKSDAAGLSGERVVVLVPLGAPLGGHARVAHDIPCVGRYAKLHPISVFQVHLPFFLF